MRYELTDGEWGIIKPMLPNKSRGIPRVDDRRTLNGIFWVLRSGAPWRDLPKRYGPHTTCYNRLVRWREACVWDEIMDALAAATSAAARHSSWKEKGSNDRPSPTDACCITGKPPNINNQTSQSLP